jgi:phenylalanyl-tRNA synthetase beta chain
MKFNYRRLLNYVPYKGTPAALCALLTRLGLEVEGVEGPGEELEGLKVGEILKLDRHPNADRLTVCQVDLGLGPPRTIVCGASNHGIGCKVVVASPGVVLPGDFKIEARAIRGVESAGMLCSMKELGLGEDHEGIILLPDTAVPGESPTPYLTNIELAVTANRPDCLGWIGVAREVAAAEGLDLTIPQSTFESDGKETIPILLDDPEGCPRYLGRIVRGVKVDPSPAWLRNALVELGMSSINNVVDITNFVLMERGHPLHAFDLSKLSGPEIHARKAKEGESLDALNGETYELSTDHLVIADAEKAVALAGVMGGANSEVDKTTTDLLIECAYFQPSRIRRASSSLGLSTDSSYRFERGTDPWGLEKTIDRCVGLILELTGGKVTSDRIDTRSDEHLPPRRSIHLRPERSDQRIGAHIPVDRQCEILSRLGCSVEEKEDGTLEIAVPSYRPDLVREIDLIEELARHFGYEELESQPPDMPTIQSETVRVLALDKRIREFFVSRGWYETKSFSFSPPDFADRLGLSPDNPLRHSVSIQNPISRETAALRTTLCVGLLETLANNLNRGERSLRVFETGKVYLSDRNDLLQCERHVLGLAWMGSHSIHWSEKENPYDFFDAKGEIDALFAYLNVDEIRFETYACDYFHPGQSGRWEQGGRNLAVVGRLHPHVSKSFDFPTEPILVEIDLDSLLEALSLENPIVEIPSAYPPIRRDLSLTVPLSTTAEEVASLIRESETPHLENLALFDRYTGEQIGENRQSFGFRITYRSPERTLTEEEIAPIHQNLLTELNLRLGAIQRGTNEETVKA